VSRVRVGLVGTGVIAQVMHLHYLAELADRFEVAAVCDLDGDSARGCAERYGIPAAFTDWHELVAHPLDAVMVLTSGSHAPIAEAAARAGRHVFVEKPMCYSAAEGQAMVAAADQAGVILMVGYPKRYDPAFTRMREETAELEGARLLRVTTSESPLRPYIGHYPLLPRVPLPAEIADGLRADSQERIKAATSTATELERQVYEMVLLDTLVHELNTVRGLLGEPTRLDYASLALDNVTVMLRFGDLPTAIHWIDLPGIARYEMEFALYAPDRRLRLTFPSPFLRNEPAVLEIEGGTGSTGRSWRTEEVVGYESGFKNELMAFHDSIVTGRPPPTSGRDGLRDVTLCQAIIDSHHRSAPVDYPSGTGARAGVAGAKADGTASEAGGITG
jgi:predicted dehydrogenase